jgi:hypothetical protein
MKSAASCVLVIILAAASMLVHVLAGSPAGFGVYVFAASLLLAFVLMGSLRTSASVPALSLTNVLWAWLVFEYLLDGSAVSVLGVTSAALRSLPADAYSRAYLAGTAAVIGLLLSSFTQNGMVRRSVRTALADERRRIRIAELVFGCFGVAGVVSLIVLLKDEEVYGRLLYQNMGLAPRAGLGRYSGLVFILPTTLIATWFLLTNRSRPHRSVLVNAILVSVPFGISLLHLAQGRRLVWAGTVMMALHILQRRRLARLRLWWVVAGICVALPLFNWVGVNRSTGLADVFQPGVVSVPLFEIQSTLTTLHDGAGRFDITAALIQDRDQKGFYWGATLLQAPLFLLPVALGRPRPLGIHEDIGRILYGDMHVDLVSQAPSAVAELYCNFGYAGVVIGFFLLGALCKMIDGRWARSCDPIAGIAYGLCLFRLPHHLVTAASVWFGLTVFAFSPLILTAVAIWMLPPSKTSRPAGLHRSHPQDPVHTSDSGRCLLRRR